MAWHRSDWLALGCAAIFGASGVGFVIGVHGNQRIRSIELPAQVFAHHPESVTRAVPYASLITVDMGPNKNWTNDLSNLADAHTAVDVSQPPNQQEKLNSLELRRERRAYAGAPPVIPHVVGQQRYVGDCMSCHGQGIRVDGRLAPPMSHPEHINCTQCHVESANRVLGPRSDMADNSFVGLAEPTGGPRFMQKSPPVIPHSTWMRENCMSCHGPLARPGLQTTHPDRTNCRQCHGESAQLDQHHIMPANFMPTASGK